MPQVYRDDQAGRYEAIGSDHPAWLPMVYSDTVLTTQLNGDESLWTKALATPVPGEPTSSSSQPSLMAQMLEALDVSEAHDVLEVGTGTGYNAALMSHRLGSARVTTAEVDPQLCARAQAALHGCGYTPKVFCGDGTGGYEPGAPYDRIIATCSIRHGAWDPAGRVRPHRHTTDRVHPHRRRSD